MIRSRARLAAAVLIVVSAAAFAICISVERQADAAEHAAQSPATSSPTAPARTTAPDAGAPTSTATLGVAAGQGDGDGGHDQGASGGDGADSDSGSAAVAEPTTLLFGVNLESTGLVVTAVVLEVLLAGAILMLGTVWLPAVIALVMLGFGILGAWEILHQLEQFRFELAAVATAVALLHVLAAVAAYLARTGRIPGEAR